LIAAAATSIKMAHEAAGNRGEGDEEILPVRAPSSDDKKGGKSKHAAKRAEREYKSERPSGAAKPAFAKKDGKLRPKMTRLYVGLGRRAGTRPADLVGAIANESGLSGKDIGSIEMGDGFSLVEVPEEAADSVIEALTGAKIRGQRVQVRRERFEGGKKGKR
jgi:ATP-dependent RNA helicase DeaD